MNGRILVMRGGALGDFVLGLPALTALREAFPEARIELIAPRAVLPLAAGLVDSSLPIELAENSAFFGDAALPRDLAERYAGLDLVVLWLADPEGAVRRHFEHLGAGRIICAPSLPPRDTQLHATDYLLGTLAGSTGILPDPDVGAGRRAGPPGGPRAGRRSAGTGALMPDQVRDGERGRADTAVRPYVEPDPAALSRAAELLRRLGFSPGDRIAAVHPGSGGRWKCWPAERFARVIEALALSGQKSLLISGPADEEVTAAVLAELRDPPPVVSELRVDDLAALLSLCGGYVGNDSGVTHLAAAVGVPVVALFGPTDPAVWGPRGKRVTIIRAEEGTLEAIPVDRVTEMVRREVLDSNSAL